MHSFNAIWNVCETHCVATSPHLGVRLDPPGGRATTRGRNRKRNRKRKRKRKHIKNKKTLKNSKNIKNQIKQLKKHLTNYMVLMSLMCLMFLDVFKYVETIFVFCCRCICY